MLAEPTPQAVLRALIQLPVYDNSAIADPATGQAPLPVLVLHMECGRILGPSDLTSTPGWAKPIVAAAPELSIRRGDGG